MTSISSAMAKSLHLASHFVISCGTVTLDLERAKILLIRWRKTNEVLLPKGRKNINESLQDAALRETWEETGHKAVMLPTALPTLATDQGERILSHREPIAVSQRMNNDVLKIIFWFSAASDSTKCDHDRPIQEDEDFETIWASLLEYESLLTFEDDRRIARLVVEAAAPHIWQQTS
ncbi:hypothetical protein CERZMDRAFT_38669 [Cercospora zeae-maydis SCOH1-5]|uniref:Nudix hydrolase domain-containing protein n=1 Tax=Cercospora zeae-maydis SCOH1-5 TaxID=717836 RepID=A0A6A6FKR5_9PEZI|nr:hypothetical protein CERZMDRAFT_38669 [Cercospora zeae-maydis SCOH1-5]